MPTTNAKSAISTSLSPAARRGVCDSAKARIPDSFEDGIRCRGIVGL